MMREPPSSTLFPYPSLFRSEEHTSELQSHSHLVCLEFSRKLFRSDRKSTRLNYSHTLISYAVFCLKKKKTVNPCEWGSRTQEQRGRVRVRAGAEATRTATALRAVASRTLLSATPCFFFKDTATPEIYTLPLHDALPI